MKLLSFTQYESLSLNEGLLGEILELIALNKKRRKLKKLVDQAEGGDNAALNDKFIEMKRQEALKRKRISELEDEFNQKTQDASSKLSKEEKKKFDEVLAKEKEKIKKAKEQLKESEHITLNEDAPDTWAVKDYEITKKWIKDSKNLIVRKASYPKLKKEELDLKMALLKNKRDLEEERTEYIEKYEEEMKEKFRKQIKKISDSNLPLEKKKIQKSEIRKFRDETLGKASEFGNKQYDNKIDLQENKDNLELQKTKQKISDLREKYPVEDNKMKTKLDKFEAQVDFDYEQKYLQQQVELETEYIDDAEKLLKVKERIEQKKATSQKKLKERLKDAESDIKKEESEIDKAIQGEDNEEKKAALETIKEFQTSLRTFVGLASGITDKSTKEEKEAAVNARKQLNDVKAKVTPNLVKTAGYAEENNAENVSSSFTEDADEIIKDLEETLADIEEPEEIEKEKEEEPGEPGIEEPEEIEKEEEPDTQEPGEPGESGIEEPGEPFQTVSNDERIETLSSEIQDLKADISNKGLSDEEAKQAKKEIDDKEEELNALQRQNSSISYYKLKGLDLVSERLCIIECEIKLIKEKYKILNPQFILLNETIAQKFSRLLNKKV